MYGRGSSQPSGYISLAWSFETDPAMMTFSPAWTPERMSEDAKFALGF